MIVQILIYTFLQLQWTINSDRQPTQNLSLHFHFIFSLISLWPLLARYKPTGGLMVFVWRHVHQALGMITCHWGVERGRGQYVLRQETKVPSSAVGYDSLYITIGRIDIPADSGHIDAAKNTIRTILLANLAMSKAKVRNMINYVTMQQLYACSNIY